MPNSEEVLQIGYLSAYELDEREYFILVNFKGICFHGILVDEGYFVPHDKLLYVLLVKIN